MKRSRSALFTVWSWSVYAVRRSPRSSPGPGNGRTVARIRNDFWSFGSTRV